MHAVLRRDEVPVRSVENASVLVSRLPFPNAGSAECVPDLTHSSGVGRRLVFVDNLAATEPPDHALAVCFDAVVANEPVPDRCLERLLGWRSGFVPTPMTETANPPATRCLPRPTRNPSRTQLAARSRPSPLPTESRKRHRLQRVRQLSQPPLRQRSLSVLAQARRPVQANHVQRSCSRSSADARSWALKVIAEIGPLAPLGEIEYGVGVLF